RKSLNLALLWHPHHGFKIENLRRWATWVLCPILRNSDYLASVIQGNSHCIVATQRGKGRHHAVPQGSQTYQVIAETAKVLLQRIWRGNFGNNRRILAPVRRTRLGVWSTERAEIGLLQTRILVFRFLLPACQP